MKNSLFYLFLIVGFYTPAQGKLQVLTSTTTLKFLAEFIGADHIQAQSIIKGVQDPHYISAKPSYMLKARKADLLLFVGLDLEVGWLPNIISGSRNPRIQNNQPGFFDASRLIQALSIPEKVDRFFGDIHPGGNPHYLLDPLRAVQVSEGISQRLAKLDPKNKQKYLNNQKRFKQKIEKALVQWKNRIQKAEVKKIVTYHSSFEYFLKRFDLQLIALIEEKPGIPPSAKHLLKVIQTMKTEGVSCILMSSFYNNKRVKKIQQSVKADIQVAPTEVKAVEKAADYFLLIDSLVQAIENCGAFVKHDV